MNQTLFFFYWIAFSVLSLTMAAAFFIWARRKGLFRDQDRARYLALWAAVPNETENQIRDSDDSEKSD